MNSNDLKNRASSFWERLKHYAAFLIRYIVFICRKFPLIAALFLILYAFLAYRFLSPNFSVTSNSQNLPIPQQTSSSSPSNIPTTPTAPVVQPAQATAVRSGSNLSLRWSLPVEDPLIYSEKSLLDSHCLSQRCNITLNEPISQVEVYWRQSGKRYVKNFKLETGTSNTASQEDLKEQAVARLEEKHQQLKQKRLEAAQKIFAKGKVFTGTVAYKDESQPIKIEISEIVGDSYIVEVSNPKKEFTQIFEGEITETYKGEYFRRDLEYSPKKAEAFLFLKSRAPQSDLPDEAGKFYTEEVVLLLASTDLGVDGVAESIQSNYTSGWDYKVVLRQ